MCFVPAGRIFCRDTEDCTAQFVSMTAGRRFAHDPPIALQLTPHMHRMVECRRYARRRRLADRTYDLPFRDGRARRGHIKPALHRKHRPLCSAFLHRHRDRVEKRSENYPAVVKIASAKIWMRSTSR
jgi:hypothetical protein